MKDALSILIKESRKFKIIDKEEIKILIDKAQRGDKIALDKVVKSNMRFVINLAKQFTIKGMDLDELIASGNEGLLTAIYKYDISKNVPFTSYAAFWIKQAMYTLIYYCRDTIRLPLTQIVIVNRIAKVVNATIKETGNKPTNAEIAAKLNIPVSKVDFLAKFSNRIHSLDEPIGGNEEYSTLQEIIPSDYDIEEEINNKTIERALIEGMNILSCREQVILKLAFGIDVPVVSLTELGKLFGISKERIRQIRDKALYKLKEKFSYLRVA